MNHHKNYLLRRLTIDLGKVLNVAIDLMTPFDVFESYLEQEGIKVIQSKFEKITQYVDLLISKNEELNLTRIQSEEEVWVKHIFDSIIATKFIPFKKDMKVMDLGTGGGLPGIPIAILYPNIHMTLVDATEKKANALRVFVKELNLRNVKVISARAEDLGHDPEHREDYDLILARAVAPLKVLTELTIPLIHPYGYVAAYKGPDYIEELAEARNAIIKLKAIAPKVFHYSLPQDFGKRTLLLMTKKEPVPDMYPRRSGMPKKRPL